MFAGNGRERILNGGTNCKFLDNEHTESLENKDNIKYLKELYESFGLKQIISEPTSEITRTTILINDNAINQKLNLLYAIRKFLGNVQKQYKMEISRQMKYFNTGNFICDLASFDWQLILRCSANSNDIVTG